MAMSQLTNLLFQVTQLNVETHRKIAAIIGAITADAAGIMTFYNIL
jgi:hypothetical protein